MKTCVLFIIRVMIIGIILPAVLWAEYATPGTSRAWTMDSLVVHSGGAVTGGNHSFQIWQSVTVSPTDTLRIGAGDSLLFVDQSGSLFLKVNGILYAEGLPGDSVLFSSLNQYYGDYGGIEFRNSTSAEPSRLSFCIIEYAKRAVKAVDSHPLISDCTIRHSADAALDLAGSNAVISRNRFIHNRRYTVKMTLCSAPLLEDNYFADNNFENSSPYVFITVGLQGTNSPVIRGNTIIGGADKSGGIVIWGQSSAKIEYNRIKNCAYGILCYGSGANPLIRKNILVNNSINPDTVYFGFGIACNGANQPVISGNSISGHFYGVAIINGAQPNVGNLSNADTTDDGRNRFLGNGIGSRKYELYNNNPLPIVAEGNWWGTDNPDSIEARIVHQPDNPAYGWVDYDPFLLADPLGIVRPAPPDLQEFALLSNYPNPFNGETVIELRLKKRSRVIMSVYDVLGREVTRLLSDDLPAGNYRIPWQGKDRSGRALTSGVYIYRLTVGKSQITRKMLLIR